MSKINYEFKARLLNTDIYGMNLPKIVSKISLSVARPNSKFALSPNQLDEFNDLINSLPLNYLEECKKINHASFQRKKRLKNRVRYMLEHSNCLFLTLTFTDNYLANTIGSYRKIAIKRYLKQFNVPYIANIDFGKLDKYVDDDGVVRVGTKREHYHAIIMTDFIDLKAYKMGYIQFEHVRHTKSPEKLSAYIDKLTNHAIKETTKRNAVIYSRSSIWKRVDKLIEYKKKSFARRFMRDLVNYGKNFSIFNFKKYRIKNFDFKNIKNYKI